MAPLRYRFREGEDVCSVGTLYSRVNVLYTVHYTGKGGGEGYSCAYSTVKVS